MSVIVRNQGESLKAEGIEIDYFIAKPGLTGYLSSIPKIRRTYMNGNYDLAHAHYSLCGFITALAGCKPLVVSLLGSDVLMTTWLRILIRFFYKFLWNETIVKTNQMKELLKVKRAHVIPNGVDLIKFHPMSKENARRYLKYDAKRYLILLISGINRPEKNLELARDSINLINNSEIEFKHIYNIPNNEIPYYLNSADALLLTSKWEGSANVIKEAMACGCPIVSTDVGDVRWITEGVEGCFITSNDPADIANKIISALVFNKKTKGHQKINELQLDSIRTAKRIISIYQKAVLNSRS